MAASALSFSGDPNITGEVSQLTSDSRISFVLKALEEFSEVHLAGVVSRQLRRAFDKTSQDSPTKIQQAEIQGLDGLDNLEFGSNNPDYGLEYENSGIGGTSMDVDVFDLMTWDLATISSGNVGDMRQGTE
jgi:hypothetical protein